MTDTLIATVITAVFGILSFLGVGMKVVKYIGALKESVDVAIAGLIAMSDGKLDPEEIEKIKKEFDEAKAAWKK